MNKMPLGVSFRAGRLLVLIVRVSVRNTAVISTHLADTELESDVPIGRRFL